MVKIRGEPNDMRAVQAFKEPNDKEAKAIRIGEIGSVSHVDSLMLSERNKWRWKSSIQSHLLRRKQEPCLMSVHDSIGVAIWIPKQARPETQSLTIYSKTVSNILDNPCSNNMTGS